jgi:hypothetical protein
MRDDKNHIRQVKLPSGKIIEVIYFGVAPAEDVVTPPEAALNPPAQDTPAGPLRDDMHICPRCVGELVYPVDWAEAGPKAWEVRLRCPECEWGDAAIFSQPAVERFDLELDRGAEVLLRDLQQLSRANMADDVDRFILALRDDHIVPTDF